MGLLKGEQKLNAAASSLHQFYPVTRTFFRQEVDDRLVEAATVFLYTRTALDVCGRKFVQRLDARIQEKLKYSAPEETRVQLARIADNAAKFEQAPDHMLESGPEPTPFERRIRSTIKALLTEAGQDIEGAEIIRDAFVPLEQIIKRMTAHLQGIKQQSPFLLRK